MLFICLMATFENFEDIEAWQKARDLSKLVYEDVRSLLSTIKGFKFKDRKKIQTSNTVDVQQLLQIFQCISLFHHLIPSPSFDPGEAEGYT